MSDADNTKLGFVINGLRHITSKEASYLIDNGAVILDVRPDYELGRLFDVGRVIYCSYTEISENLSAIPKDRTLIIADAVGLRSREVAGLLMNSGFEVVYNLAGGIVDWERAEFSVTTDKTRILSGPCMCQLKTRKN